MAKSCPYKNTECFACGKRGHLAKMCRSKSRTRSKVGRTNMVEDVDDDKCTNTYMLFSLSGRRTPPIMINVLLNGQKLAMELDTGAAVSLISESVYQRC